MSHFTLPRRAFWGLGRAIWGLGRAFWGGFCDRPSLPSLTTRNLLFKIEGNDGEDKEDDAKDIGNETHTKEEEIKTEELKENNANKNDVDRIIEPVHEHDDMREESESESELDVNVISTFAYGDAHIQLTDPSQRDKQLHSVDDRSLDIENGVNTSVKEKVQEVLVTDNKENMEENVDKQVEKMHNSQDLELDQERTHDVYTRVRTQDETEEMKKEGKTGKKFVLQTPVPAPRRSSRQKKSPNRYGEFVFKCMNQRPIDNRLQALDEVMKSGILNNMDSDTAHRIVSAIRN